MVRVGGWGGMVRIMVGLEGIISCLEFGFLATVWSLHRGAVVSDHLSNVWRTLPQQNHWYNTELASR